MDFSLKTYKSLLHNLQCQGFSFQTFQEFIENLAFLSELILWQANTVWINNRKITRFARESA